MAEVQSTCVVGGVGAPPAPKKKKKSSLAATSEWTAVRQVCWSVSDWLSPARNRVRCARGPPVIG